MTRRVSHPLGMIPPGPQLTRATDFVLLRHCAGCSAALYSRSTAGKRSAIALSSTAARKHS